MSLYTICFIRLQKNAEKNFGQHKVNRGKKDLHQFNNSQRIPRYLCAEPRNEKRTWEIIFFRKSRPQQQQPQQQSKENETEQYVMSPRL